MERKATTDKLEFGLILDSVHRELEPYDPHIHDEFQRRNEEMRAKYKIRLKVVIGEEGFNIRGAGNGRPIVLAEGYDGSDNAWSCDVSLEAPNLRTGTYHNVP